MTPTDPLEAAAEFVVRAWRMGQRKRYAAMDTAIPALAAALATPRPAGVTERLAALEGAASSLLDELHAAREGDSPLGGHYLVQAEGRLRKLLTPDLDSEERTALEAELAEDRATDDAFERAGEARDAEGYHR